MSGYGYQPHDYSAPPANRQYMQQNNVGSGIGIPASVGTYGINPRSTPPTATAAYPTATQLNYSTIPPNAQNYSVMNNNNNPITNGNGTRSRSGSRSGDRPGIENATYDIPIHKSNISNGQNPMTNNMNNNSGVPTHKNLPSNSGPPQSRAALAHAALHANAGSLGGVPNYNTNSNSTPHNNQNNIPPSNSYTPQQQQQQPLQQQQSYGNDPYSTNTQNSNGKYTASHSAPFATAMNTPAVDDDIPVGKASKQNTNSNSGVNNNNSSNNIESSSSRPTSQKQPRPVPAKSTGKSTPHANTTQSNTNNNQSSNNINIESHPIVLDLIHRVESLEGELLEMKHQNRLLLNFMQKQNKINMTIGKNNSNSSNANNSNSNMSSNNTVNSSKNVSSNPPAWLADDLDYGGGGSGGGGIQENKQQSSNAPISKPRPTSGRRAVKPGVNSNMNSNINPDYDSNPSVGNNRVTFADSNSGDPDSRRQSAKQREIERINKKRMANKIGGPGSGSDSMNSNSGNQYSNMQQQQYEELHEQVVAQNMNKPASSRMDANPYPPQPAEDGQLEPYAEGPLELYPCPNCGRQFNSQTLDRHIQRKQCQQKPRKVFDIKKKLIDENSVGGPIPKKNNKITAQKPESANGDKQSKWRVERARLQEAIRAGKQISKAIAEGKDIRDLPQAAPSQVADDRVPCPHCGRNFAALTAERHIPHCKNTRNKAVNHNCIHTSTGIRTAPPPRMRGGPAPVSSMPVKINNSMGSAGSSGNKKPMMNTQRRY